MSLVKKKFKITDMHCSSCALTIDMDLEDLDGVKSSRTSYGRGISEVELDSSKVRDEEVIKTIKRSGYNAIPLDS